MQFSSDVSRDVAEARCKLAALFGKSQQIAANVAPESQRTPRMFTVATNVALESANKIASKIAYAYRRYLTPF